jgi:hypothetical protein
MQSSTLITKSGTRRPASWVVERASVEIMKIAADANVAATVAVIELENETATHSLAFFLKDDEE